MITNNRHDTARRWGRNVSVAAGSAAASAAISLLAGATAHADAVSDATIGAGAISDAAIGNFSELLNVDAAVSPITTAIDTALVPITAAQAAVGNALDLTGLSAGDLETLMSQDMILTSQASLMEYLGTFQTGLTSVDPADLASLDGLLTVANQNVLDATTGFIGALDGPMASQMTATLDLVIADIGALGTDANVIGVTFTADLLGLVGIDPGFLFDGLAAGI